MDNADAISDNVEPADSVAGQSRSQVADGYELEQLVMDQINALLRKVNTLIRDILSPISPSTRMDLPFLPEKVGYALQYKDRMLSSDHIKLLLRSKFGSLGMVMSMKLCRSDIGLQHKLLSDLLPLLYNDEGDYTEVNRMIYNFLENHCSDLPPINGGKAPQVCLRGPYVFERGFDPIVDRCRKNTEIPVLIANSALIGLRGFVQEMEVGSKMVIVYPEELTDNCGYLISCNGEGLFDVSSISINDLDGDVRYRLIDDTIVSGGTLERVGSSFSKISGSNCIAGTDYVVNKSGPDHS